MLNIFQKETKLFELLQDMNREELKIRKNDVALVHKHKPGKFGT